MLNNEKPSAVGARHGRIVSMALAGIYTSRTFCMHRMLFFYKNFEECAGPIHIQRPYQKVSDSSSGQLVEVTLRRVRTMDQDQSNCNASRDEPRDSHKMPVRNGRLDTVHSPYTDSAWLALLWTIGITYDSEAGP